MWIIFFWNILNVENINRLMIIWIFKEMYLSLYVPQASTRKSKQKRTEFFAVDFLSTGCISATVWALDVLKITRQNFSHSSSKCLVTFFGKLETKFFTVGVREKNCGCDHYWWERAFRFSFFFTFLFNQIIFPRLSSNNLTKWKAFSNTVDLSDLPTAN